MVLLYDGRRYHAAKLLDNVFFLEIQPQEEEIRWFGMNNSPSQFWRATSKEIDESKIVTKEKMWNNFQHSSKIATPLVMLAV